MESDVVPHSSEDTEYDDIGEFFFESDHVALKGNNDYHRLLKAVVMLEAQRARAIQDLDKLHKAQETALRDPITFVKKLQEKEDLDLPCRQKITAIPHIDWNKYTLTSSQGPLNRRQFTRLTTKAAAESSLKTASLESASAVKSEVERDSTKSHTIVRGRVCTDSKPPSFNQLWSAEEQKQLEALLLQYPPEEVESRRWEKIATALGNRTPTQVASRVQKYFIKLAKAGLPVPGRIPHVPIRKSHYKKHFKRQMLHQSTFLVSHTPPVYMADMDDDFSNPYTHSSPTSSIDGDLSGSDKEEPFSEEEGVSVELANTPEYQELMYLKKLKADRLNWLGLAQHVGFQCDRCECEPIVGTRWHCIDCPPDTSTDFCNDCVDCDHETSVHLPSHQLRPVRQAQSTSTYLDRDYMHFMGNDYNYLDPNYMPAT